VATRAPADWSREEVEVTVADYLAMLAAELAGVAYSKTEHRKRLAILLNDRSDGSIEFKHQNISAVLMDLGVQSIRGYKARSNYQGLLYEIVAECVSENNTIQTLAAEDAERHIVVPEVEDILAALTNPPRPVAPAPAAREPELRQAPRLVNYLEREARNRSLGNAGEEFVLRFECARLIHAGREPLAAKIEHVSKVRGDGDGYDVLSFEVSGEERLIEVKTTKYAPETPFFVSRNEMTVSRMRASQYHLYRLFDFRDTPRFFALKGALAQTCQLTASTFMATVA
jgi:hypothetical protein